MTFNFDQCPDRRQTDSLKWQHYADRDILPLWVADMDFLSPPAVIDALTQRINHGVFGYALPPKELNQAVVDWLQHNYRWQIEAEWLVWLPGLVPALNTACCAYAGPGEEVLTFSPVYPPFLAAPERTGRTLIDVPLKQQNNHYTIDFEALKRQLNPNSRLLLLCHPHNPVGRAYHIEELQQLKELCLEHQLIICSDEIHCDLMLDGRQHIPFASIDKQLLELTITLMSPAKTFNIAGLNCGFAVIANPKLRRRFSAAAMGIMPHPNALGYAASQAAYQQGEPWRQQLIDYLRGNRNLLQQFLDQRLPMLTLTPVEATYLAWINVEALTDHSPSFFEQAGVGLMDGGLFGDNRYVRLNFGCPRHTLLQALQRIENAVNSAKN